jgi:nitrogen PTS system EIIA component
MLEPACSATPAARSRRHHAHADARRDARPAKLVPTDVLFDLDALTKEGAFREVARAIGTRHGMTEAEVYAGLSERERIGSTALGQGVAIPHARVRGLDRTIVAYVRMKFPISFEAPDGKPVSNMLVLLVPRQATDEHLALLAQGAEMFCDKSFRDELRNCRDVADVQATFAHWG